MARKLADSSGPESENLFVVLKNENTKWIAECYEDNPSSDSTPMVRAILPPIDYERLRGADIGVSAACLPAIESHGQYLYDWLFRDGIVEALQRCLERLTESSHVSPRLIIRLCFHESYLKLLLESRLLHWEALMHPRWAGECNRAQLQKRNSRLPQHISSPFLILNPSISIVRQAFGVRTKTELAVAEPLKMLVIRCNPEKELWAEYPDLPGLTRMHEEVVAGINPLREQGIISLIDLENPSVDDCQAALKKLNPHVFVFLGHGYRGIRNFDDMGGGGIVLRRGGPGDPQMAFQKLVSSVDKGNLRLAVLIACHSSGAAPALLKAGVPAVVGMNIAGNLPFPMRSAKRFAEVFFRELAKLHPLDECMLEARSALWRENPQFPDWLIPELWTTVADTRLFRSWEDLYRGQYLRQVLRAHSRMRTIDNDQQEVELEKQYVDAGTRRLIEKPMSADAGQRGDAREQSIPDYLAAHERVMQEFKDVDLLAGLSNNRIADVGRFYVWGAPGAGKTTALIYMITCFAQKALNGQGAIPIFVELHALADWLKCRGEDPNTALLEFLQKQIDPYPDVSVQLKKGVVLFFDALDEVADLEHRTRVCESLTWFAQKFQHCHIVITSRMRNVPRELLGFTVLEMKPFDEAKTQQYAESYFGRLTSTADAGRFMQALRTNPSLKALCSTPLLLSLMCYLYRIEGLPLPAGQTQLFDRATRQLLQPDVHRVRKPFPEELKRRVLEAIAFQVTVKQNRQTKFSYGDFQRAATKVLRDSETEFGRNRLYDVLTDVLNSSGLLQRLTDGNYAFLHLGFQEYFAACGLATNQIVRALRVSNKTVWNIVDKKAWDPDWEQFILFFAGKSGDSPKLLNLLMDRENDDFFRHRLALAALCLPEILYIPRQLRTETVDRITSDATSIWWEYQKPGSGTDELVTHLTRCLPELGCANGRLLRTPLFQWLCERVKSRDENIRDTAISVFWKMESLDAVPKILSHMTTLLCDPQGSVRGGVALVLGKLRKASLMPEILSQLSILIRDEDIDVRIEAAQALGEMGSAVVVPEILSGLSELLRHPESHERDAGIYTLRKMGSAAAPEIISHMTTLLRDPEGSVRGAAALVLGELGKTIFIPEILSHLTMLLRDDEGSVRRDAVFALGLMGRASSIPEVISRLIACLHDSEWRVRGEAALTLGRIGSAAVVPQVPSRVCECLRDQVFNVQQDAARSLGEMGSTAAMPEVLSRLAEFLGDPQPGVRHAAISAITGMRGAAGVPEILCRLTESFRLISGEDSYLIAGVIRSMESVAAVPEVLSWLSELLCYNDWDVRDAVADVLGAMQRSTSKPKVINWMSNLLRASDWDVRCAAANALGKIGSAAAVPEVLDRLCECLRDPNSSVQCATANALGKMGSAAAVPEVLHQLCVCLGDRSGSVRSAAIRAIGEMGITATPDMISRLRECIWDPDDFVRCYAIRALGEVRSAAAVSEILSSLTGLLSDPEGSVRGATVIALGDLGRAAALPEILSRLRDCLRDPEAFVRTDAEYALGKMGGAAAVPEILSGLCECFRHSEPHGAPVPSAAADALVKMGRAAAVPEVLSRLNEFSHDPDWSVRRNAAHVLGQMMQQNVRFFQQKSGKWIARTVAELAE